MLSQVDNYWFEIRQIRKNLVGVAVFVDDPRTTLAMLTQLPDPSRFIPLRAWITEKFIPFIVTRDCSVPPPEKNFHEEPILAEGARQTKDAIRFEIEKVGFRNMATITEDEVLQLIRENPPTNHY
jgi:hypothetical protein